MLIMECVKKVTTDYYHFGFKKIVGSKLIIDENTPEQIELEVTVVAMGDCRYLDSAPYNFTILLDRLIFE